MFAMSARAKFDQAFVHFDALTNFLNSDGVYTIGGSTERANKAIDVTNHIYSLFESVVEEVEKAEKEPPPWANSMLKELCLIRATIEHATEEPPSAPTAPTPEAPEVRRSYSAALVSHEPQKEVKITETPMTVVTPRRRKTRARKPREPQEPAAVTRSLTSSVVPTANSATTTSVRSSAPSPTLKAAIVNERPIVARRIIIRGSGPSSPNLAAAPRMKTVHAFYLAKNTTINQVEAFVKQIRPSAEPRAERIVPRGDYASFKIRVPEADFDTLMAPEVWPTGVAVNEWRTRAFCRPLNC